MFRKEKEWRKSFNLCLTNPCRTFLTDSVFVEKMEEGYHLEDWIDLSEEDDTDVIPPPRVTNIPSALAALTINIEEDKVSVPEVTCLRHPIEAQPVSSISVYSQLTYSLSSSIKSRLLVQIWKELELYLVFQTNTKWG